MKAKRAFKTYCEARDVKLQEDSPPLEGAVPDIPAEIRLKTWSNEWRIWALKELWPEAFDNGKLTAHWIQPNPVWNPKDQILIVKYGEEERHFKWDDVKEILKRTPVILQAL